MQHLAIFSAGDDDEFLGNSFTSHGGFSGQFSALLTAGL